VSIYRHAESAEESYEALVPILAERNRLELIGKVNRTLNRVIMKVNGCMKEVFESLEAVDKPTMQLVGPSYYLLQRNLKAVPRDSKVMTTFWGPAQEIPG